MSAAPVRARREALGKALVPVLGVAVAAVAAAVAHEGTGEVPASSPRS